MASAISRYLQFFLFAIFILPFHFKTTGYLLRTSLNHFTSPRAFIEEPASPTKKESHDFSSLDHLLRDCPRLLSQLSPFRDNNESTEVKLKKLWFLGHSRKLANRDHHFATSSPNEVYPLGPPLVHNVRDNETKSYQLLEGLVSVSDCFATVKLRITLSQANEDARVCLDGDADSYLIGGILELLIQGLQGESVSNLLSIKSRAKDLISELFMFMGPSRAKGVGRIIDTIQEKAVILISAPKEQQEYPIDYKKNYPTTSDDPDIGILLSGGVDSSLALFKLLSSGYKVKPYYVKIWLEDELKHLGVCPWEEDISFARETCKLLGQDLQIVPLQNEYWEHIIKYTLEGARSGLTPNPDVLCNEKIKFGAFLDLLGGEFRYVASGHYAKSSLFDYEEDRIIPPSSDNLKIRLFESEDPTKDQTYFLSRLNQDQLRRVIFPIGNLTKYKVRELAALHKLPTSERHDSQGLCFLGKLPYSEFLGYYLGNNPGDIVDIGTQQIIGKHRGLWFYTIGQHRAIGPSLEARFSGLGPWEVISKDLRNNILYVTNQANSIPPRSLIRIRNLHWVSHECTHPLDIPKGLSKELSHEGTHPLDIPYGLSKGLSHEFTHPLHIPKGLSKRLSHDGTHPLDIPNGLSKGISHLNSKVSGIDWRYLTPPHLNPRRIPSINRSIRPYSPMSQNDGVTPMGKQFSSRDLNTLPLKGSEGSSPSFHPPSTLRSSPLTVPDKVQVRVRHGPKKLSASIFLSDYNPQEALIRLDEDDRRLAPGQFVVIYSNSECLGSGEITNDFFSHINTFFE